MTFITGPGLPTKSAPTIDGKTHVEHVVQMHVVNARGLGARRVVGQGPPRAGPMLFIFTVIALVALAALGLLLAILPNLSLAQPYRYHGFCTIPIKDLPEESMFEPYYKVMPLRWSEQESDVQLFSDVAREETEEFINSLREQFDIGDKVEKISVMDNGRHVNFIHDFETNKTGIEDTDRCFTMDLDQETVMSPEVLVLSIEGGAQFDVSRVRSSLRAALPAVPALADAVSASLRDACRRKPIYSLHKEEVIIRKRAADAPSHDYIQFAGRRVQEIEISNLADLLQHEQDSAQR